jgi:hypothetical protein
MVETPESVKVDNQGNPYGFQAMGQSPLQWGYHAESLRRVAEKAFELAKESPIDLPGWHRIDLVYKFLAEAAIEDLLKGIMVADNPDLVKRDRLSNEILRHNIWTAHTEKCKPGDCKLKEVESQLEPDERDFMKLLEPYVWLGRYGIGKKETQHITDLKMVTNPNVPSLEDFNKLFNQVYGKLAGLLGQKMAAPVIELDKKDREEQLKRLAQSTDENQ